LNNEYNVLAFIIQLRLIAAMIDQTRELILEAAGKRFTHYGYSKTTIAEIAADCEMSVGNVYRFFTNKEAIALAGAEQKMEEKASACEAVVDIHDAAVTQLASYCHQRLAMTHGMACNSPHLNELVGLITERHQEVVQLYDGRVQAAIESILERGIASGEMRDMDVAQSAAAIRVATFKYCIPTYMHQPIEVLQAELDGLISLIYQGLKA